MNKLLLKLPNNHIESFALHLAVARIERIVSPAPAANSNPKILHTPVVDTLLENSAARATDMLTSLLLHLDSRNAHISNVARPDFEE